MSKLIIHLGYPKTGTTYLQRRIFSQLCDSFTVITPEFQNCGINIRRLMRAVELGAVPERYRARVISRNALVSLEGFLLEPIRQAGGSGARSASWQRSLHGLRSLARDTRPDELTLVLYLRRQDELAHSLYAESKTFHFDRVPALSSFEKYAAAIVRCAAAPVDPGYYFDFGNTIGDIERVFPGTPLRIRFYEDLETHPEHEMRFWGELCQTSLTHMAARENSRRQDGSLRQADRPNPLRAFVLGLKNAYLPGVKLPNRLSVLARRILSQAPAGDPELIEMTAAMRSSIRAKFCRLNASPTVAAHIPPHLRACYLVPEAPTDAEDAACPVAPAC